MENRYHSEAWDNRPGRRVYGYRIKPFCLYYLHLLQSIDSPLLYPNKPFGPAQLLIAAEICCSTWNNEGYTLDRILRPSQFRKRDNQLRVLTCKFQQQLETWRDYYQDFVVEAAKWEDIGEEYDTFGGLVSSHKEIGRTDLDKSLSIATSIIVPSGWDEDKVMMMPFGRALGWSEYFAIHAGNDKIKFVTAVEEEIQRREDAKMAADEKAKGDPDGKLAP